MSFNFAAIPTVALSGVLFVAGALTQRRVQSKAICTVLLLLGTVVALPGLLILLYYTHLCESPAWFYAFRTVPYAEISMCGLGWIVGYCYSLIAPEGTGEKAAWPIALFVLVSLPFIKPILDPINLEALRTSCPDQVCLQTTYSTCGPSSAASILLSLGQDASEQSLAREALTSKGGTELWYLARALRRRGFSTNYVVGNAAPASFPTPAVAGVVLTGGTGHFIGLISRNGDELTLVDPLKGKIHRFRQRTQGKGIIFPVCFFSFVLNPRPADRDFASSSSKWIRSVAALPATELASLCWNPAARFGGQSSVFHSSEMSRIILHILAR